MSPRRDPQGTQLERNRRVLARVLAGYRFHVCRDAVDVGRALDLRRQVSVDECGYDVPVPDRYDTRSWLLAAEEVATGACVGTMRSR